MIKTGGIQTDPIEGELSLTHFKRSGYYVNMPISGSTVTVTLTANRLATFMFYLEQKTTFDRISISVQTLGVGTVRLGIYSDSGGSYPANLVLDAGTVDVSSTGVKEINISQTLEKGLYWLVCNTDVSVILTGATAGYGMTFGSITPGTVGFNNWYYNLAYDVFPTTFAAGAIPSQTTGGIYLRKV